MLFQSPYIFYISALYFEMTSLAGLQKYMFLEMKCLDLAHFSEKSP